MTPPTSEQGRLTPSIPIITDFGPDLDYDSMLCKRLRLFLFLLLMFVLFSTALGATVLFNAFLNFVANLLF